MQRLATWWAIIVCLALFGTAQVTGTQAKLPAEKKAWPSSFAMHDKGQIPLPKAGLSQDELIEIKRIALTAADQTCRKALGAIGDEGLYQKLLIRRIKGSQIVVVQAGADFEDSSDNCFLGPLMNVATWVIVFSEGRGKLLLQSKAVAYSVMDSRTNGLFDIVTSTAASPGLRFRLTWWRFDGQRYEKYRCASEHYSSREFDEEALQKTARIIEHHCR